MSKIPREAQELIFRHIHSVAQLEALLFVRAREGYPVSADVIAHEQRIGVEMASAILTDLVGRELVEETADGYVYGSKPELRRGVDALADAYGTYRVTIINLIFSKPSEGVQSFADAFRLRKDED